MCSSRSQSAANLAMWSALLDRTCTCDSKEGKARSTPGRSFTCRKFTINCGRRTNEKDCSCPRSHTTFLHASHSWIINWKQRLRAMSCKSAYVCVCGVLSSKFCKRKTARNALKPACGSLAAQTAACAEWSPVSC